MANNTQIIDAQSLIKWLRIMAEGMEAHRKDVYFEGAAKSYRIIIKVVQDGAFNIEHSTDVGS